MYLPTPRLERCVGPTLAVQRNTDTAHCLIAATMWAELYIKVNVSRMESLRLPGSPCC